MALIAKKPNLTNKIISFITAAPTTFSSDDENEEAKAKVVERYDESESEEDAIRCTLRKRNVDLLDQIDNRYKGKKVSRNDVFGEKNESEASESEDTKDDDDIDSESRSCAENKEIALETAEPIDKENGCNSEIDEENPLRRERRWKGNFKNTTETNAQADVERGNCVREELKIWENLLEVRIRLQKCLIASNKMPQFETHKDLKANYKFKKGTNESIEKLSDLMDNLLEMRNCLLENYSETKNLRSCGRTKRTKEESEKTNSACPMDVEIPSITEDEAQGKESSEEEENQPRKKKQKKRNLTEYERILAESHSVYRDYRNSVIQKWNDKTRVATGSVNKGSSQAVVKQIELVLRDKTKLLRRTQLKRSEYGVVGKVVTENENGGASEEYDPEIFDDDDFYHQLLRELIEYKSNVDIADPIKLSKQWIQLRNMRNKIKRKIETRATKGRRIRYNVHAKLVNFMAPINVNDGWSDLAKNELYNSLFGKIKSSENETSTNE